MKGKGKPPMSAIVVGSRPNTDTNKDSKSQEKDKKSDSKAKMKASENAPPVASGSPIKQVGAKSSKESIINGSNGATPKKQRDKVPPMSLVKTGKAKAEPQWPAGVQPKSPVKGKGVDAAKDKTSATPTKTTPNDKQPPKQAKSGAHSACKLPATAKTQDSKLNTPIQKSESKKGPGPKGKLGKIQNDTKQSISKSPKQGASSVTKTQGGKQSPKKETSASKKENESPKPIAKKEEVKKVSKIDSDASKTESKTEKDSLQKVTKTDKPVPSTTVEKTTPQETVKDGGGDGIAQAAGDLPETDEAELEGRDAPPPEEERADEAVHVLQSYLSEEYWDLVRQSEELDSSPSPLFPDLDFPTMDYSTFSPSLADPGVEGATAALPQLEEETGEGVLFSKSASYSQPAEGVFGYVMSTNLSIKESNVGCTVLEKPKKEESLPKVPRPIKRCIRRSTPEEKESEGKMHGIKSEANEIRDLMEKLREQMSALDNALEDDNNDQHTPPPEAQLSYVFKVNLKQDTPSSSDAEEKSEVTPPDVENKE